jgi:hypothetical protein
MLLSVYGRIVWAAAAHLKRKKDTAQCLKAVVP